MEVESLYREPDVQEEIAWGALELRDVFRIYRSGPAETVALKGLDLRVEEREIVAVFGPSGSGKSTMLQLAAGLDTPSAGEVRAFGRSLAQLGERELAAYRARGVAVVFQNGNLLPWLSTAGNVQLSRALGGGAGRERAVDDALDAFGLARRARLRAGLLSGGEQQRVALARALAQQPDLLLCDEPTGHLDSDTAERVLDLIEALRREFAFALVVATHDADVAARFGRRLELEDGVVVGEAGA